MYLDRTSELCGAVGIVMKGQNVVFLVGLAFAIAASANIPELICSLFWKRATDKGIIYGIFSGLIFSVLLIVLSPTVMGANALFSLNNPGIINIPLGFAVTAGVSLARPQKSVEGTTLKSAEGT